IKGQTSATSESSSKYRGAQGLAPELVEEIERMYGFDKPLYERFFKMMSDYATFNFGDSFFRDQKVVDLVLEKMPVSI
ncbi:MAG TPA: microcin ABC transporter permease, partial [Deltaproteobacteria bacterium]|nr:microcin ABC transporter permease [Deltaproteobacteria bacterium]